ncbi:MAG: efflux RND transporter periplasmic adaptor subunit [Gammaproteobacteria bacterium]|nr:efflux RND transporter periplasmic adaptor subunit [Gammaproteobacteria bacterium]MDE0246840.1 efflux RND transporter periplasmic adaptor subunit [Gammaproteobacteria bacterium]
MSRVSGLVTAGAIVLVSLAIAALLISRAPEPTRTDPPAQIPFAQTGLAAAGSGPIPVYGAGTVRPSAEIDIAPQVSGRVVSVDPRFRSGGRVAAGQTLFRIEDDDYRYQVEEAEANLAARRVALLEERERSDIARTQYEFYSDVRDGSASGTDASPLTLREPQLNAAIAAVERDEARLASVNLALSRTVVTAPFAGFVREESVDLGQIVAAGQPVGRLFASDAVEVVVPLSDADAALVPGLWAVEGEAGASARVTAEYGAGSYVWEGYVDRAEAFLDAQTRTIDIVVRVPDPFPAGAAGAPPLLVGEFVEVEIEGIEVDAYFRVPRAALQPGDEVWMVRDGAVTIVPVQVLQRADDEVFVTGSLAHGAAVVTGGLPFATEGMPVQAEAGASP